MPITSPLSILIPHKKEALVPWVLMQLVAFSIPFPIRVNSLVVVVCSVVCLLYLALKYKLDWGFLKTPLFVLVLVHFIVLAVGLVHSPDVRIGLSDIERFSFAMLFVVLVYENRNSGTNFIDLARAFTAGCIAISLYAAVYTIFVAEPSQREQILATGHHAFTNLVSIHPTYLTIYLIFIITIWVDYIRLRYHQLSRLQIAGLCSVVAYAVLIILFVRSQLGLLIFAIVVVLYPIVTFKRRATLVAFFLFITAFVVYLTDPDRVSNFLDNYGLNVSTALENRIRLWRGAMEAISESPIVGAGTGGEQVLLNSGYRATGYQEGIDNSHNAHNQYFEFVVRNGIVELLVFLTLLAYNFRVSMNKEDQPALVFNMIFALTMVAESCLNVHKGIVPFYFFSAVFVFLPMSAGAMEREGAITIP